MSPKSETDFAMGALVLWWKYESSEPWVAGYPPVCPSTRGWVASRQYDYDRQIVDGTEDFESTADVDSRKALAERVGGIIHSMPDPHKTALSIFARNRACGWNVWRSPRLPEDEQMRAELVGEALERFMEQL